MTQDLGRVLDLVQDRTFGEAVEEPDRVVTELRPLDGVL
jgi:hypothetical protein